MKPSRTPLDPIKKLENKIIRERKLIPILIIIATLIIAVVICAIIFAACHRT